MFKTVYKAGLNNFSLKLYIILRKILFKPFITFKNNLMSKDMLHYVIFQ